MFITNIEYNIYLLKRKINSHNVNLNNQIKTIKYEMFIYKTITKNNNFSIQNKIFNIKIT
jgi:hypothetical protein